MAADKPVAVAARANQLEPEALVRAFVRHPPEGFQACDMARGTPGFFARFDLLTTADPALKARLARLPFARRWMRWLRIRTAFVGTTVSEYALYPRVVAPAVWLRQVLDGPARQARLLIVKDIPQDSPLLAAAERRQAEELAHVCREAGMVLVEGQALAYVPIDFTDIDAYLARLSAGRRKDIRRKLRSRADLAIERIATGDARFDDDATVDAYYARYAEVYAQSEIHFDRLTRAFFAQVLRDPDSGGVVFEYRHEGALIGFNLCFVRNGMLVDKYVGFAYPQAREHNLYFVSWIVNLDYALAHGCRFYVAGWTDPAIKAYLGARFTFTRHAVLPRNRLLRALLRRTAHWFESDAQWKRDEDGA